MPSSDIDIAVERIKAWRDRRTGMASSEGRVCYRSIAGAGGASFDSKKIHNTSKAPPCLSQCTEGWKGV
jgi:hypothetical protein